MTQYDNTNRGIIGKNKRHSKETDPDITGSINIDGKGWWLSGWKKVTANGTFYSLAAKPKDGAAATPERKSAAGAKMDFSDIEFGSPVSDDDTIPF